MLHDEAIIKTMEDIIQLQIMATESIKHYEEIKLNPFEEAVNVEAEFKINTFKLVNGIFLNISKLSKQLFPKNKVFKD